MVVELNIISSAVRSAFGFTQRCSGPATCSGSELKFHNILVQESFSLSIPGMERKKTIVVPPHTKRGSNELQKTSKRTV